MSTRFSAHSFAAACLALGLVAAPVARANCCHGNEVNFQVLGAQTTIPTGMNASGVIVGYYSALNFTGTWYAGFVRDAAGNITSFNPGGSLCNSASALGEPLCSTVSVNDSGVTTGFYFDSNRAAHGFVGDPTKGPVTSFVVPGSKGTYPMSINNLGLVVGFYQAADNTLRGFFSNESGSTVTFVYPGAQLTIPTSIARQNWWVAGIYYGNSLEPSVFNCLFGCVYPNDTATVSLLSGSTADSRVFGLTWPWNTRIVGPVINSSLGMAGSEAWPWPPSVFTYLRDNQGNFLFVNIGGSGYGDITVPTAIDEAGDIVGYGSFDGLPHAFLREAGGYEPYSPNADPAGSVCAVATAINNTSFAGFYSTTSGCTPPFMGFVYLP